RLHRRVIQVRFPESWSSTFSGEKAVLTHRPGYFCLDNAFALIEGTRRVRSPMFLNLWLASPNLRFAAHNLNAAQIRMCQSIRTPSTNIASAHLLGAHRLAPPLPRHVCSQNQDVPHAKSFRYALIRCAQSGRPACTKKLSIICTSGKPH